MKLMIEPLEILLFWEKIKRMLLHHLPLKEQMKDRSINYVDLFHPDPIFVRFNDLLVPKYLKGWH